MLYGLCILAPCTAVIGTSYPYYIYFRICVLLYVINDIVILYHVIFINYISPIHSQCHLHKKNDAQVWGYNVLFVVD